MESFPASCPRLPAMGPNFRTPRECHSLWASSWDSGSEAILKTPAKWCKMSQLGLNMVKTMAIFANHHCKKLMIQWFGGRPIFRQTHMKPKNAEILCDFRQHHFQETFCCGSMLVSDGLQKASLGSVSISRGSLNYLPMSGGNSHVDVYFAWVDPTYDSYDNHGPGSCFWVIDLN